MNVETYARDVKEVRSGGCAALRLELAARRRPGAPRRHVPGRAAAPGCATRSSTIRASGPDEEHRLPRHAGGAARHRHGHHRGAARREVLQEKGAPRLEPQGDPRRIRLRRRELRLPAADPSREDARHRRSDPDRRQHGDGARLPLCRRHRGRLVPDHAVHQRDGLVQGALRGIPQRSPDGEEQLLHRAGRGRAGGDRDGDRRVVERRARLHLHGRPRDLAHERAHRPRLLRRDPGGDRRRAAHRALDRDADPHPAGGHPRLRVRLARRHQAHPALPLEPGRVLHDGGRGLRPGRAVPDAGVSPLRSRHRDERLGLPAAQVGRRLPPEPRARPGARASSRR